jgi:hypothetical protein
VLSAVQESVNDSFPRFDMLATPRGRNCVPIAWAISYPDVWAHRARITKIDMADVKPPYLLLCNHNAFLDFKVTTATIFPHRANYVVAIDGYTAPTKRGFTSREWLMRTVGCICKRKFTNDPILVRQSTAWWKHCDIAVLYPGGALLPHAEGTRYCRSRSASSVKLAQSPRRNR